MTEKEIESKIFKRLELLCGNDPSVVITILDSLSKAFMHFGPNRFLFIAKEMIITHTECLQSTKIKTENNINSNLAALEEMNQIKDDWHYEEVK